MNTCENADGKSIPPFTTVPIYERTDEWWAIANAQTYQTVNCETWSSSESYMACSQAANRNEYMTSRISLSIPSLHLRSDQLYVFDLSKEERNAKSASESLRISRIHSAQLFPISVIMLNFRYWTGLTSSITACIRVYGMLLNSRCRFLEGYFYVFFLEFFSFFLRTSLQKQSYS